MMKNTTNSMHVHATNEEEDKKKRQEEEEEDGLDKMMESTTSCGGGGDLNWEDDVVAELDKEMWFQRDQDEDLLDVQNAFINYDDFPPLPDFPSISSSSSSSSSSSCSSAPVLNPHSHSHSHSNPNNNKTSSSTGTSSCSSASSSSVTSWAHRREIDKQQQHMLGTQDQALVSTGSGTIEIPHGVVDRFGSDDYMDVMEELGGMDLLDPGDIWDPSSLFPCDDDGLDDIGFNNNNNKEENQGEGEETAAVGNQEDGQQEEKPPSEDLATMFFEWLKSNKESISAEDLRSIKLKRSTIECAAKRLGGGKEGMKQLLKLILEWVQNHQLQKKQRMKEDKNSSFPSQLPNQNQNPNPSPDLNPNNNPYLVPSMPPQWLPRHQPTYIPPESTTVFPPPMMYGYLGEPLYNNGAMPISPTCFTNQTLIPPTWPPPPPRHYTPSTSAAHYPGAFPDQNLSTNPPPPPPPPPHVVPSLQPRPFTPYGSPYPCQLYPTSGDRLVRLGSSATKEARKKRMARQKRFFSHSRSHNQQHQQGSEARLANDTNCTTASQHASWIYWPSSPSANASPSSMLVSDPLPQPPQADRQTMQPQQLYQRQVSLDRRQASKPVTEKNLKFLLQKVLKQSDVGNLGRIVLPKKEAETYLPGLDARDGISIAMEDIGTSRIWNMRYRFWPNNKSRMYLLENTGEFVRSNGLQEGDFIVIYSDAKCGKYLIRGVKVRQPGSKSEVKKQGKTHRNVHSNSTAAAMASSSSMKETVR